jgi:hypothetical protein
MTAAGAAAAAAGAAAAAAVAASSSSIAATSAMANSINRARAMAQASPPTGPLAPRPFDTVAPPPIESLGKQYFTPLVAPLPVVTRLPQPAPNQETVSTFLRIQAGGGSQTVEGLLWNMALILHSYAPNEQESVAEQNIAAAEAWGANAQGTTITLNNGQQFYITYSRVHAVAHRQGDPNVDLIRYRSAVMWRIAGNGVAMPS